MKAADLKQQISIEDGLHYYGSEVKNSDCNCPFGENHRNGDIHPSGSIKNGKLTCHSQGCVKAADIIELVMKKEVLSFKEACKFLEQTFLNGSGTSKKRIVATYGYTDGKGNLLFQTVRYDPKDFRQRRPDGKGGWIWSLKGMTPVLFQLPAVLQAESVLVLEGEKDVLTALQLGLPEGWAATCNPMGAEKWKEEYSESLKGKHVFLVPDRDEPGERHVLKVGQSLRGKAASISICRLPEAKDLTAWVESGGTPDQIKTLLEAAKPYTPKPQGKDGLPLTSLNDLLNEPEEAVEFLVENLLPSGGVSVIGGKPKAGKSTTVRNLAVSVASGEPFLGLSTMQGPVFYLAFEEKRGEVRGHFKDLGANSTLPILVFCGKSPDALIEKMKASVAEKQPALIILDTLAKAAPQVRDFNDYASMMQALDPFLHIARDTGAHLLFVHHAGKGDRNGGDALLGSTAIFGTVDTCLIQKRSEKYRTLEAICRYGQDLEEAVLEWEQGRRAITLGGSKKDTDIERLKTEIKTFLEGQEAPVGRELIEETIEGKNAYKRKALKELVTAGEVDCSGKGRRGDPHLYSLSCTLVPHIYQVQENTNPENGQNPHEYWPDSCTPEIGVFEDSSKPRVQEKLRRKPTQTTVKLPWKPIANPEEVVLDNY